MIARHHIIGCEEIIKNDSNIFKNMDFNDPGFKDCSMMFAASNGIKPKMFPKIVSETILPALNIVGNNGETTTLRHREASI